MRTELRRFAVLPLVLVLLGIGGSACGDSDDAVPSGNPEEVAALREEGESVLEGEARECEPPEAIPVAEVADLIPTGVTLPDGATIIGKVDESTHVTFTAQLDRSSGATPTTLRKRFQDELESAGYEITGGEDEGHESEVFFAFDDGRKGTVQSVKSACPPGTVRFIISYVRVAA